MRDRLFLLVYLAAVVTATLVHAIPLLAAGLALVALLAWRRAAAVLRRALLAVLVFNLLISVSYVIVGLVRGDLAWDYLVLINLRVLLITSMTFLLIERINAFRALAFSPTLAYLLTLASTQLLTFRRLYEDMRLALVSRSLGRLGLRQLYRHGAASGSFFVDRALSSATESAQAMRSRGFFE
ncbi:MAG TPA: ABC transporter permease [Thioalkalivibrio sp.]|nr:ABC transporter permease [Thioalkalivibrio sp.]